jgi:hypothetical protein
MKFKATKSEKDQDNHRARCHPLQGMSDKDIDAYVDEQVTDLESMKEFIKTLAHLVVHR